MEVDDEREAQAGKPKVRKRLPTVYVGDRVSGLELDDQSIEATVFPTDGIRQAPVSPVDGRPMKRANTVEVEALLDS